MGYLQFRQVEGTFSASTEALFKKCQIRGVVDIGSGAYSKYVSISKPTTTKEVVLFQQSTSKFLPKVFSNLLKVE